MKKITTLLLVFTAFFFISENISAQVFWTEEFGTACNGAQLPYTGSNGTWTTTSTGINGTYANVWYVSAQENGNPVGACGSACSGSTGNATLHVGSSLLGDMGASYFANSLAQTNVRAESPTINCTGKSNITLAFKYIQGIAGQANDDPDDKCDLWYYDGVTWSSLSALSRTPNGGCSPQGKWTLFTVSLPASANNNANVKIGFNWTDDGDGVGADPSFAVDSITLSAPAGLNAAFSASDSSLCTGQCITFTDMSTGGPIIGWGWSFGGGTPSSFIGQTPGPICYNTPGTYTAMLAVITATDTDSTSISITVANCTPVVAAFTVSDSTLCDSDCVTFTDNSTGSPTSWAWSFPGGSPSSSTSQNPGPICYNATGNYNVQLIAMSATDTDTTLIPNYIVVTNCAPGTISASFTSDSTTICSGSCVNFTDASNGNPTSWSWSFPGGSPASSTSQNPGPICYSTPGSYNVQLIAMSSADTDTVMINNYITVNNCSSGSSINAGFTSDSTTICAGSCINFTDTSSGSPTSWSWTFPGGTPSSSTSQNPTICYSNPGVYNVTLVAMSATDTDSTTITNYVTINACGKPVVSFQAPKNICYNQCYSFTNNTTGATSYLWFFEGGMPDTSTAQNPDSICYDTTSVQNIDTTTYIDLTDTVIPLTITLQASNANGTTTVTDTVYIHYTPTVMIINPVSPNDTVTINSGVTVDLQAQGSPAGGDYLWYPISGVECPYCAATTASPMDTTDYTVRYKDKYGCVAYDTVTVDVDFHFAIGVPSAFSPNGDGVNDILYVRGSGVKSLQFLIYNRYGQKVFESDDMATGWDGTMKGKKLNPGVFVYYVKAVFTNGTIKSLKGNVTLVR